MKSGLMTAVNERVSELRDALSTLEFAYKHCADASAVDLTSIIGVACRDACSTLEKLEAAFSELY